MQKTDANLPAGFTSPGHGPLGYISEGRCSLLLRPTDRLAQYVPVYHDHPQVSLMTIGFVSLMTIGFDRHPCELVALTSPPLLGGLVVAGLGAGTIPPDLETFLVAMADRMPVVMTSSCGQGEVASDVYAFLHT